MKKLMGVALGLSVIGQARAELNFKIGSLQDGINLLTAVQKLPENLDLIKNKVTCSVPGSCSTQETSFSKKNQQEPQSLEATTYALKKYAGSLATYSKSNLKGKSPAWVAQYKIAGISNVLALVINFLEITLSVNGIIRNDIISPILSIAGQQSLLSPLDGVTKNITDFKTQLSTVYQQLTDIFDLIALLNPEMADAQEKAAEEPPAKKGKSK